ncbi:hypothetical protein EVAR_61213_1 [Eumeta japonica]|uniref:Uncharacterized protein n=1 Tax=Eumeta variegata TaxID=151549 RepID=A0A4C1YWU1_EUMVA|nr:hypothetical protein EVAR_61213_1 [Eumeta japonica]
MPELVIVHWDGKLLPSLDVRNSKEEHLPILMSFGESEQLLAVPKLESSSDQDQAKAVLKAFYDWNLDDKVQIMCCDTTSFNTGRLKGACVLFKQKLDRELLLCLPLSRLRTGFKMFKTKIHQVTTSPDMTMFKNFRDN